MSLGFSVRSVYKPARKKRKSKGKAETPDNGNDQPQSVNVIVAKVLLGQATQGTQNIARPPVDPQTQRAFNSTINGRNLKESQIFVVFESAQAYPEYLVTVDFTKVKILI